MKKNLPPIGEISVLILTLVFTGGILLAAHLPRHVSLLPTLTLVLLAAIGVVVNLILLNRITLFDWTVFLQVAKWTLLAYGLIAGALEYIFILDGTRGKVLALMTGTLVIFAINLPIHFGFTVARYSEKPF